jgi:sec-independent protein translocase protein TatA
VLEFLEKPGVVIVILLAIVVFGAKRLPDSARALGRSMRILKAEAKGLKDDGDSTTDTTSAPVPKALPESSAPVAQPSEMPTVAPTETPRQT